MNNIKIKSIKIAPFFSLKKIADIFGSPVQFNWDEYIILNEKHLEFVLKYGAQNKYVYIFKYGCISFANFEDKEIFTFIKYIESIGAKVNYSLTYKYYGVHNIKVLPNQKFKLLETDDMEYDYSNAIIHTISIILSKSTELYRFESELTKLLVEAEKFIIFLKKGRLGSYRKKSSLLVSKIMRFKYDSIYNIKILDRPSFVDQSLTLRNIYDSLSSYYELDERLNVIKGKTDNLHDILDLYTNLSFNQSENRLLLFEIFLLTLFPLSHIFHYIPKPEISLEFLTNLF